MRKSNNRVTDADRISALNIELGLATWVSDCGSRAAIAILVSIHEVPEDDEPTVVDCYASSPMASLVEMGGGR
jgi:hypothetical protein